jgi:hypothetical protein
VAWPEAPSVPAVRPEIGGRPGRGWLVVQRCATSRRASAGSLRA